MSTGVNFRLPAGMGEGYHITIAPSIAQAGHGAYIPYLGEGVMRAV